VETETSTKKRWDGVYSEKFMTMWYPNEDIIRFCARLIQKKLTLDKYEIKRKVQRVLDLGCGNGRHALYFASQGFEACGIDIAPKAIEWAQEWAAKQNLEADFRVGDITALPFEDRYFDVVVSHGVLDHVPLKVARSAVLEVKRTLKTGGLFYCDLRCSEDFEYGLGTQVEPNTFLLDHGFEEGLVQHFYTQDEINELIDGLFRVLYIELNDNRLGPDFTKKYSRWVVALESF
jgi:SAM-dependent methyltransferase